MLAENAKPTTQAVLSRDGTPIACERRGQGHPLILVDGALCSRTMGPSGPLAKVTSKWTWVRAPSGVKVTVWRLWPGGLPAHSRISGSGSSL